MHSRKKILTIPNLLSLLRLCLVPLIIWLYCEQDNALAAAVVLALSGLTDVVDGFIARRFHMISDLGKVLDPIADKTTQGTVLLCLLTDFPAMLVPLVLLIVKEAFVGITGLINIRKTGVVKGADWHGKVTTCMIYAMMAVHLLWPEIPAGLSGGMVAACVAMMILSMLLYGLRNLRPCRKQASNPR